MNKFIKTYESFHLESEGQDKFKNILPDFYIAKIDETKQWSEEIISKIAPYEGKIFAYYLYDKSQVVRLASIEGSYELNWLYNRIEVKDVDLNELFTEDELTEIERNNGDIDVTYYSERSTFNEVKFDNFTEADLIEASASEEDYRNLVEKAIDYLNGNPKEF